MRDEWPTYIAAAGLGCVIGAIVWCVHILTGWF